MIKYLSDMEIFNNSEKCWKFDNI